MYRKVKFSLEFKKECLDLIILNYISLNSVSKEKGVSVSLLRRWKSSYDRIGLEVLVAKETKTYSASFKLEVLQLIYMGDIS